MDDDGDDLPVAGRNALRGDEGETLVALAVTRAGHVYRPNTSLDFGIDGRIEILRDGKGGNSLATGREIAVQSKRGRTVAQRTRFGFTHYFSAAHRNYWLGHSLPVILAHSSEDDNVVRWAVVTDDAVRATEHGYAIDLPVASDLAAAGAELTALGEGGRDAAIGGGAVTLLIRMSPDGELVDDPTEVGLAALEASRRMTRTGRGSCEVEIEGTDALIAVVDAVADMVAPDAEARRRKVRFEDALDAYRSTAAFFTKAVSLLLGAKELMGYFGTDDEALASAIAALLRSTGRPLDQRTAMQAWPAPGRHEPNVGFDVTADELEQMLGREPGLRGTIRMGDASAYLVRDLPRSAIQLGLIPSLLRRFVNFAETSGTPEREILSSIGVDLDNWVIGLG